MTDRSAAPAPAPHRSDVARLLGGRVLVVGDVLLDRFVHGSVQRISPEAPVPVLRRSRVSTMLGGAGNVAANVMSLGGRPRLIGVVGDDAEGEEVAALCAAMDLHDVRLVPAAGRPTSVKTRLIADNQQVLRLDVESVEPLERPVHEAVEAAVAAALGDARMLVLSDYGKGVLGDGGAERLIARARAAGTPVLVDPKGIDYDRYRGATYITPNLKELHEATGLPVASDAQVEAAARTLLERLGLEAVIATRSEKGVSVISRDAVLHAPTEAREVFDVSGAGDTAVATLALALAGGASLADAARLANVAAGVAVSKRGTAQVSLAELAETLRAQDPAEAGSPRAADLILAEWRRRDLRIGFTNGCFDIVHPGHVALLSRARALCDRLVVGLNADASVRRLKGEGRPINDEASRRIVLEALRSVDLVLAFEEDTPEALIRRVRPDVLIKGADYTLDQVVGADFVLASGGRVELVPLVEGQSTTAIARRASPAG